MTDSGSQNHWKSIADLLGTPVSSEPEPPPPPPAARPIPAERPRKEKEPKPVAPKRKNHWGFVLSAVGLAAQPADEPSEAAELAPQEAAPPTPVAEATPVDPYPVSDWPSAPVPTREQIEDDPLVMPTESVFDEVASPILTDEVEDAEIVQEDADSEASGDAEEPRRRRRRRRRGRRRRDEGAESTDESASSAVPPRAEIVADTASDIAEGDEVEWTTAETSPPTSDAESADRPRRRRRRRRGRRDRDEARSDVATDSASPELSEAGEDDESDVSLHDDHDDADELDVGGSDVPTHRKIPTWREAIGVLVDANLANHTKTKPFRGGGGGGRRRPN